MCKLVHDNFLYQLVTDPTRKNNLLDFVFTNNPDFVTDVNAVDNLPSTDHDAVQFTLCTSLSPQQPCQRTLYNYTKADLPLLNDILSHIIIEACDTVEES